MFARTVRLILAGGVLCVAGGAQAALECTHVVNAAETAIELRDRGVPLSAVLAETERADMKEKFNMQELNILRQIIRVSYSSEFSVREIFQACEAGELGIPRKKK